MAGDYARIFSRNIGAVSAAEQQMLRNARVAVIGLGGIGGAAFELLLRSGIGNFTLVDRDEFEITNLNRQLLAGRKEIGRRKTEVARELAKSINPEATVAVFSGEFNGKNAGKLIAKCDIAVDGLDDVLSRVVLSREARKRKIPYVFGAASGALGMSTVFAGESYERCLSLPSEDRSLAEAKVLLADYPKGKPILGVVAAQVGVFQATQALCVLLKKPFICAPQFAFFGALSEEKFCVKKLA